MPLSLAIRFALLGMIGFVCACLSHEAIGHCGACLATGGRILLLTSVYARCAPGAPFVDAGGILMNLAVAAACWLALARLELSSTMKLFTVFVFAFNAMWGAGYFIYSAVLDVGDLGFVWRDLHASPAWLWRLAMGGIGVYLYGVALRVLAPRLPPKLPVLVAYFSAGALAAISVTLAHTNLLPALREALSESLLASIGLPYLVLFPGRFRAADSAVPAQVSGWFTMVAIPVIVVFLLSMGRGFGSP
jgi:hypothetical protein